MQACLQEETYGKPIIIAERGTVETGAETDILTPAQTENVALLVVGDALWCVLSVLLVRQCCDRANCNVCILLSKRDVVICVQDPHDLVYETLTAVSGRSVE